MTPIVVGATSVRADGDTPLTVTSTTVQIGGESKELWHAVPDSVPTVDNNRGDIWLPPVLVMAMRRGEPVVLEDPVSDRLLAGIDSVQDIFTSWFPDEMQRVTVTAPSQSAPAAPRRRLRRRDAPAPRGLATCFSGGVDSFYTFLKHRADVEHLFFAFGLDIPLHQHDAVERVDRQLREIADQSGKNLLTARTNVRRFIGREASWGYHSHGAAIVSVATMFSPLVSTLLVPSSFTYAEGFGLGTHPLLDRHWSTDRLEVVHDGAEADRCEKTEAIADDPLVRRNLRVCYSKFEDTNCGRCDKCLRTMVALELLGKLAQVETFPDEFDLDAFAQVVPVAPKSFVRFEDALRFAERLGGHEELTTVLRTTIAAYRRRVATETLTELGPGAREGVPA